MSRSVPDSRSDGLPLAKDEVLEPDYSILSGAPEGLHPLPRDSESYNLSELLLVLFVLWLAFGLLLVRKGALFSQVNALSKTWRKGGGLLLLVISAAILLGGLLAIGNAAPAQSIGPLQWAFAALIGLIFVACQMTAVAMLVSLAEPEVTGRADDTSTPTEPVAGTGRLNDR